MNHDHSHTLTSAVATQCHLPPIPAAHREREGGREGGRERGRENVSEREGHTYSIITLKSFIEQGTLATGGPIMQKS